jgi:hypothetical protein
MPGTYEAVYDLRVFKRLIAVLKLHHFFQLNYESRALVLGAPHLVVALERCGVTTKLDWPWHGDRKDIPGLFDGLDSISKSIDWQKTSDSEKSP